MSYVVQHTTQDLGSQQNYDRRGEISENVSPKWRLRSNASKSPLRAYGKHELVYAAILRESSPSIQQISQGTQLEKRQSQPHEPNGEAAYPL